jgi:alpha-beta hydrolase superfamily lysophospholipase
MSGSPRVRTIILGLVTMGILIALLAWVVLTASADAREDARQDALAPFYQPPDPLPDGRPGDIIRAEPLGVAVDGGRALRILYLSEAGDGTPRAASGMVFIPEVRGPAGGRPVISWAHGTIGLGDTCAPSRTSSPTRNLPWISQMLARGWVVTATDYAGLGTPGPSGYLISAEEGRDVINAVRAARSLPSTGAGNRWIAWGHSQGGHAALAAGSLAAGYAPDLTLEGVATAAPAAELARLFNTQWNTANAWVIGSDVAGAWPDFYPELARDDILSANGEQHWKGLFNDCLSRAVSTALIRQDVLRQDFFRMSPWQSPAWRERVRENTPRPLPASMPFFVGQSTADSVVLPETTASLINRWCATGMRITTDWIGQTPHQTTAIVVAPSAVQWMQARLANQLPPDDCGIEAPVPAASPMAG